MAILAFDTCLGAASAALNIDGSIVGRFELCPTGHAERLMPLIEGVLADGHLAFADINRIAVTLGPGGFTGLRVGISAARALALALEVPVVGLTSLEVLAHGAAGRLDVACIAVAAPAGRGGTYVQLFDGPTVTALGPARLLGLEETDAMLADAVAIGPGAAQLVGRVRSVAAEAETWQPDAAVLAQLAPALTPLANVRPIYLRAADAKPQIGKGLARAHDSRQT